MTTSNADGKETTPGSVTFAYDRANRLTSASVGGTTTTATYDGDGKRASTTGGGSTTSYVYDPNKALPDVLTDGTLKYVYGLGLAFAVDTTGTVQVYHTDGLGSVRAITDANGNVIQTYQTDAFGIPTQTQGGVSQPFQFTGQRRDASTGLYYLRARMYDPTIGRFLTLDPLFGTPFDPTSLNRYAYALPNPLTAIDPSGMASSRMLKAPRAADNDCTTTLGGTLRFYGVNARCLNTPYGVVGYVTIQVGPITITIQAPAFATDPSDNGNDNNNNEGERNWRQDKKLSGAEIRKLQRAGIDIHEVKGGVHAGERDLYKDDNGNIYVKPKGGKGPGEPTYLNINDF